jgi:prevent-host-death family protein
MLTVSAVEFRRHFGRYQDKVLGRPVAITRNGRDRLGVLSVEEYERLKRRDRVMFRTEDLTDAEVAANTEGGMNQRHDRLTAELASGAVEA